MSLEELVTDPLIRRLGLKASKNVFIGAGLAGVLLLVSVFFVVFPYVDGPRRQVGFAASQSDVSQLKLYAAPGAQVKFQLRGPKSVHRLWAAPHGVELLLGDPDDAQHDSIIAVPSTSPSWGETISTYGTLSGPDDPFLIEVELKAPEVSGTHRGVLRGELEYPQSRWGEGATFTIVTDTVRVPVELHVDPKWARRIPAGVVNAAGYVLVFGGIITVLVSGLGLASLWPRSPCSNNPSDGLP